MRTKTKLMLISALSLCTLSAGVTAVAASANEGQETPNKLELTFGGASIRYNVAEKEDGIRFAIRMDKQDWDEFSSEIETTYVTISDGTKTTEPIYTTSTWYTVNAKGEYVAEDFVAYQTTVCLYGEFDATQNFTVKGYAQMKDGETVVDSVVSEGRSMLYVANAAACDVNVSSEDKESLVNEYLASYDYNVSFGETTSTVLLPVKAGSYEKEQEVVATTNMATTLNYTSSNENVATVDATGKVTAVAAGDATITATAVNGNSATFSVKVATPISSKADLDAIALDYVNNGSDPNWGVRAWAAYTYYVFTQDIDYKGEVMIPIAAIGNFCGGSWGKWGKLNPGDYAIDGNGFNGVMDGNGFAIQNAVLSIGGATWGGGGVGGNFIGYLTGTLKNLAFTNLVAESVTDAGIDGSNASNRQGIVGSLAGTMDNVFVDVYMKRGSYTAQSGGVLAAVVYKNAVMKNCVSLVDGSEDSLVWNNGNGNTFDFGLIAWTNEGVIENTFSVVKAGYHEYAIGSEIPYRDLFGATWSAAWEWGVNDENFAKEKMGYGVGTFTNLGRYTTVAELVSAHQANMGTYGYGAFWTTWLAPYVA